MKYPSKLIRANVDHNEVAKTPDGKVMQFKGNPNVKDGISTALPEGTKIFSDSLGMGGSSMQERASRRAAAEAALVKSLGKNPGDSLTAKTLKRVQKNNHMQEMLDLSIQEAASEPQQNVQSFDRGTGRYGIQATDGVDMNGILKLIDGIGTKGTQPSTTTTNTSVVAPTNDGSSWGNTVGTAGLFVNAITPLLTTLANRKSTPTNRNHFLTYGKEAMDMNQSAQDAIDASENEQMIDNDTNKATAIQRNNNATRSLNVNNAMNGLVDLESGKQGLTTRSTFANSKAGLISQRANISLNKDQMVMSGNAAADEANRKDNDNFYTNLNKDLGNIGTSLQQFGSTLNDEQLNKESIDLLSQASKYYNISKSKNGKYVLTAKK